MAACNFSICISRNVLLLYLGSLTHSCNSVQFYFILISKNVLLDLLIYDSFVSVNVSIQHMAACNFSIFISRNVILLYLGSLTHSCNSVQFL